MVTTKATFLRLWLDRFQTKLLLTSLIALFLFLSIRTNSRPEYRFSFHPVAVNHEETLGRGEGGNRRRRRHKKVLRRGGRHI